MKYPTIRSWYYHVNNLKTVDEVNESVKELRRGEFNPQLGIHDFKASNDMGRAMRALINHAQRLNLQNRRDGSWQVKTPALIEEDNRKKQFQLQA